MGGRKGAPDGTGPSPDLADRVGSPGWFPRPGGRTRRDGGRRARVRGHTKVDADFTLLAAAVNLARLATLGVTNHAGGWALSTT